jgi:hypothetical protein
MAGCRTYPFNVRAAPCRDQEPRYFAVMVSIRSLASIVFGNAAIVMFPVEAGCAQGWHVPRY